jgi:hypothetical protein
MNQQERNEPTATYRQYSDQRREALSPEGADAVEVFGKAYGGTMNQQERDELRAIIAAQPDTTHYEGCWKSHGWCAVMYVLDAWEDDLLELIPDDTSFGELVGSKRLIVQPKKSEQL